MNLYLKYYSILFVSIIFLSSCSHTEKNNVPENGISTDVINNPATASSEKSKDNVPAYKFVTEEHDFGTITEGENVTFAFQFTNVGKGDLVIRSANGSCGCTVPEFPKEPIKVGATGLINVTFNSEGKSGEQHKTVTLIANTIPATYVLSIHTNVIKPQN